ncbi:MAG: hypothetical protein GY809_32725, partial [Planctomycetes bacterium]|nr:hypothetical protein [Planctomycetota bacterium]
CPETGICSILKQDGNKIDLISDEVSQVQEASGNPDAIRRVLSQIDPAFAAGLDEEEIAKLSNGLKG